MTPKKTLRALRKSAKGDAAATERVALGRAQIRNKVPEPYIIRQQDVMAGQKPRLRVKAGAA